MNTHTLLAEEATMPPPMKLALLANFGSVAQWAGRFAVLLRDHAAAGGEVQLVFSPASGGLSLRHRSAAGDPGPDVVLLVQQIDAPVTPPPWAVVYERYQHAVHDASEGFGATADELAGALLLDVRRAGVFEQATTLLPGAQWRDPAAVGCWAAELKRDCAPVVYCVYGHEVGRATALRLRAAGLPARYLRGGIDGWQAAGLPLVPKSSPRR
jgi:Fe-Mn family superoxide dismutase